MHPKPFHYLCQLDVLENRQRSKVPEPYAQNPVPHRFFLPIDRPTDNVPGYVPPTLVAQNSVAPSTISTRVSDVAVKNHNPSNLVHRCSDLPGRQDSLI